MKRLKPLALLVLLACPGAGPGDGARHLEQLCASKKLHEAYLDFYWDDVRHHRPALWADALERCRDVCPEAINCAPVLSVASWYRPAPSDLKEPSS